MDNGTKVSFIPKKPLLRKTEKQTRPMSLLLFLSFFIFFITLAAYGGLYFYYANLKAVLEDKTKELEIAKEKADPTGSIEKAEILQAKINNTKNLLSKHVAPSRVFNLLEEVTLKSITLNGFTLEKESSAVRQTGIKGDGSEAVSMSDFVIKTGGTAYSYASLAYQSDILKKEVKENNRIKSFSITNLIPDTEGRVTFTLDLVLHAPFLSYKDTLDTQEDIPDGFINERAQKTENKKTSEEVFNETTLSDSETVSILDSIFNFFRNRK